MTYKANKILMEEAGLTSLGWLVIAFDCDGTLNISLEDPGPVDVDVMDRLLNLGAIVGICGNTDPIQRFGYAHRLSFLTMHQDKAESLRRTTSLHGGIVHVFVGNTEGDYEAAKEAGWIFIHADDFCWTQLYNGCFV